MALKADIRYAASEELNTLALPTMAAISLNRFVVHTCYGSVPTQLRLQLHARSRDRARSCSVARSRDRATTCISPANKARRGEQTANSHTLLAVPEDKQDATAHARLSPAPRRLGVGPGAWRLGALVCVTLCSLGR